MTVVVKTKNEGMKDTGEVVQVYIKALDSSHAPINSKLCAFSRIFLKASESGEISLKLDGDAFTVINDEGEKVEAGCRFLVSVGLGQPDERTRELTGKGSISFAVVRK